MDVETDLSPEQADFAARTIDIPDSLGTTIPGAIPGTDPNALPQPVPGGALTPAAIKMTLEQLSMLIAGTVKDGGFWQLQSAEAQSLADVWHPILAPLWDRWMATTDGNLLPALMVTMMSLAPRVAQEVARRASLTASTGTVKSGASQPFSDQPGAENLPRPTVSLVTPIA